MACNVIPSPRSRATRTSRASTDARGARAATNTESDLVLTGAARTVIAVRRGEMSLAQAIANGALTVRGSKRALRHFQRVFRLP